MKKLLLIVLAIFTFLACERKESDVEGPLLDDLYGPFTVLEGFKADAQTVNFPQDGPFGFSARFNKTVDWEIHIIGQTSGAHKIIEGKTKIIEESTGGVWDGSTTMLPMFKSEPCEVILKIPEELNEDSIPYADTIEVIVSEPKINGGYVVTDFENGLNPGFTRFVQSGADMRFDTVNDPKSVEGFAFYETSGNVNFSDDLGNLGMPKEAFTDSNFVLSTNDDIVYFNVFAKKGPNAVQDIYVFQFKEDDNEDGIFNPGDDDLHEFVINSGLSLDWELYFTKYSDLTTANAGGDGIKNPDKLLEIVVLPIGVKLPFEGFIDYMIFTENGPLQP